MSDACQSSLYFSIFQSLPRFMSTELVVLFIHLIACCRHLLLSSIFPKFGLFSNESALHIRWPKYWSFSFCSSTSNEYSGLISFRMDGFDLLAVWGTLKSLLQHHGSKAILQRSAFFMVQLWYLYMTTRKTIALTIWTFVSKVMFLLFHTLYKCHSFPSKEQASFNFMTAIIVCSDLGAQENKICHWF